MMSNVQWFYADAQQQQKGPVSFEQIQQLARSGQIQPSTLIWNESMPNWTAAGQVDGVFGPSAAPVAPPAIDSSPSNNPYASPGGGDPTVGAMGGGYPIPPVKKSSFALYLTSYLLGIILVIGAMGIVFAKSFEIAKETIEEMEQERPKEIQTREDAAKYEEAQRKKLEEKAEKMLLEDPPLAAGFCMLGAVLFFVISGILGLITLFKAWCVVQPGGARSTPGKAVGFLFIPLFNLYWVFVAYHGWSQDWNRIQASHGNLGHLPRVSSGLFLTTIIMAVCSPIAMIIPLVNLLFFLALPILSLIMFAQIYKVVNSVAAASRQTY